MEEEFDNEIKKLAPFLPLRKQVDPPENYFNDFPDRIVGRWKENKSETPVHSIRPWRWLTAAAVFIGVLFTSWWWMKESGTPESNDFSSAEAYQYIIENFDEFEWMVQEEAQWPKEENFNSTDTTAIEEFLLDELQGKDTEQLF